MGKKLRFFIAKQRTKNKKVKDKNIFLRFENAKQ